MSKRFNVFAFKSGCLALALAAAPAASAVPAYIVTDLGSLGGGSSRPYGLNEAGQVVGSSRLAGGAQHAFLYSGGAMQDIGPAGGGSSTAYAINDAGQIALSGTVNGSGRALLWSNGATQDLGTFGGTLGGALGINNAGQVVGYAYTAGNAENHAFLYSGGQLLDLGNLPNGHYGSAYAINSAGQAVGYSATTGGVDHAARWGNGAVQDLGTLGASPSKAQDINAAGQVVGYSATPGGTDHAFFYDAGGMVDLGTLGGNRSYAYAINALGQVVGTSHTGTTNHAFLWSGGAMRDLNDLAPGYAFDEARGINDLGQIIASGGASRAYLLTPTVPIPAAAWLFGSALAALLIGSRKGPR